MSRMFQSANATDDRLLPDEDASLTTANEDPDDDDDDDDDDDELPIDPLADIAGPTAEELPPAEEPTHADEYASGPDDALGLYLRQMGQIRLLKPLEERSLAVSLERNRTRFRRASLICAYVVARATTTLEKVRDGLAAIDPLIDVYSTEEIKLSRVEIIARMPHNLPLIRRLLREEAQAFAIGLDIEGTAEYLLLAGHNPADEPQGSP